VPTYSYACTECDHRFDAVQSFSDDSLTVCPACGGRLRKVFSAVGVVFKGGGFYRTDSRSGSSASVPAGSGDASSSSGSTEKSKAAAATSTSSSSSASSSSSSSAAGGSAA
jgi:putative FmdB family regulatory protein